MTKSISGAEYSLSKIFSSDFEFCIPSYQRPYAWSVDQCSDLFDDLYEFYLDNKQKESEEGYFLGSIVLIKDIAKPRSEVIDGQQRLTTLTILLANLANVLTGNYRDLILKYIIEPGNPYEELCSKPRLTLRHLDNDFFKKYIQELDLSGLEKAEPKNESQENIQLNSIYFKNKIVDESYIYLWIN